MEQQAISTTVYGNDNKAGEHLGLEDIDQKPGRGRGRGRGRGTKNNGKSSGRGGRGKAGRGRGGRGRGGGAELKTPSPKSKGVRLPETEETPAKETPRESKRPKAKAKPATTTKSSPKPKACPKAKTGPKSPKPSKSAKPDDESGDAMENEAKGDEAQGAGKNKRRRLSEDERSFAGRPKPKTASALHHFTAIRDVFKSHIALKLTNPSTRQDRSECTYIL